jgi:hypothetical protein
VIADYADWAARSRGQRVHVIARPNICREIKENVALYRADEFSRENYLAAHSQERIDAVVIFLDRHSTEREQELLKTICDLALAKGTDRICLVSSFREHLGDARAIQIEESLVNRLKGSPAPLTVFRPAHLLTPRSRLNAALRRFRFLAPVVPARFSAGCVEGEELFAALDRELESSRAGKRRTYTLLGANTSWKDLLARKSSEQPAGLFGRMAAAILQLCLMGHIVGLLFDILAKCFPALRAYSFDTLHPASIPELLALYNKYNYRHVKIVGYNNGVVHFGHHYPGKTVVSTIRCNRTARVKGSLARFDGGATIHQAMEVLRKEGKELYVIPNYSYVSMGTAYFIPIHGSASSYSTIGETIEKVLLYDPVEERFVAAARKGSAFGQYMYNLSADILLLRLTVRVKEKSRYFMKTFELPSASSQELLSYFHDEKASNVEIRKARAASPEVKVSLYYTEGAEGNTAALELPRDRLGSLWDRLEENAVTSFLFHALIRRLAHHVELFLSEKDFAIFWETHQSLPLSKIQLRYIKRDGMPHSPFQHHDCVSADLFMLKKHKSTFEAYLKEKLPTASCNPGKHSR